MRSGPSRCWKPWKRRSVLKRSSSIALSRCACTSTQSCPVSCGSGVLINKRPMSATLAFCFIECNHEEVEGHDDKARTPPSPFCMKARPSLPAMAMASSALRAGNVPCRTSHQAREPHPPGQNHREGCCSAGPPAGFRTVKAGLLSRRGEAVLQRHGVAIPLSSSWIVSIVRRRSFWLRWRTRTKPISS